MAYEMRTEQHRTSLRWSLHVLLSKMAPRWVGVLLRFMLASDKGSWPFLASPGVCPNPDPVPIYLVRPLSVHTHH